MNTYVKTPIRIRNRVEAEKSIDTFIEVEDIPPFERVVAAFGALILCWFIAVVCIAIPVLHFFLVPLAVLAGLVAFVVRLRLHKRRTATEFKCPSSKERLVSKAGSFNFPLKESCSSCRSGLIIEPRET